jgi:hypothetical protein
MFFFKHAHAYFGSGSWFEISETPGVVFPAVVSEKEDPKVIEAIEKAIFRGTGFFRKLKFFHISAMPEFGIPEQVEFIGNGIFVVYHKG